MLTDNTVSLFTESNKDTVSLNLPVFTLLKRNNSSEFGRQALTDNDSSFHFWSVIWCIPKLPHNRMLNHQDHSF